ncbi:uncharacterized protein [Apostichopus japonicus]|uniref:uncharacterized protein n=1 Tax=Stichopus japonicus TaxID=307972 RepID=UPI003AB2B635
MGLICPCGTGADQEERETHKTTSTGVSTQHVPKENCRQHRQKKLSSPSKKPLVVSGESTDSFRKLEHQRQTEGISHNPKDIKPCIPKNQTGLPRNEHHQRSRSSSSHHQRIGKDVQKHQRRSHSSEARSAEKRTVLRNRREHHRQYGGTDDTKGVSNVKTKRDLPHPEVKKDHGKHRDTEVSISKSKGRSRHRETEVTVVKSEMKITRNSHSPKPEKEKKAKERLLPSTDPAKYVKVEEKKTQKYVKVEEKKTQRKPRSSTPAYVIPMSAMLK